MIRGKNVCVYILMFLFINNEEGCMQVYVVVLMFL